MAEVVLVIDDSALMRKHIRHILETAGYEVVTARNGQEGIDKLTESNPVAVTLDVNMPIMDGITCLSLIMAKQPTPVVMVSSITEKGALATFEALELGAVDYILKPGGTVSLNIRDIEDELIQKIKAATRANIRPRQTQIPTDVSNDCSQGHVDASCSVYGAPPRAPGCEPDVPRLVVIGVSTGGPRTLEQILTELPAHFPLPIVIAQHMPGRFTKVFAERLNKLVDLPVTEVSEPVEIKPGHIFIAQGDADIKVVKRVGRIMLTSVPIDKQFTWHPSVERLAASAVSLFGAEKLIFVQLTGMGNDGAQTMAEGYNKGARTIAESEDTAVVFGMPKELIRLGGAEKVLPAQDIANALTRWVS